MSFLRLIYSLASSQLLHSYSLTTATMSDDRNDWDSRIQGAVPTLFSNDDRDQWQKYLGAAGPVLHAQPTTGAPSNGDDRNDWTRHIDGPSKIF
eukprot:m.35877 g.35877  ORF g.35877 m.35877 type:complete len:94 (-) comp9935_c0_seq1:165-446(-)